MMDPASIVAALMDCVQAGLHKARVAHDLHGHLAETPWPPHAPGLDVNLLDDGRVAIILRAGNLAIYAYIPKTNEHAKVET